VIASFPAFMASQPSSHGRNGHAWALFWVPVGLFGSMGSPSQSNEAWHPPSEDPLEWHVGHILRQVEFEVQENCRRVSPVAEQDRVL
jgi:hypothetical protein